MVLNRQQLLFLFVPFVAICLFLWCTRHASAQAHRHAVEPLLVTSLGQPLVELGGRWQFHVGDDAQWGSPTYDDSAWETITTDKGWDLQHHPDIGGFAWYRRHIRFADPAAANLPLAMRKLDPSGAYEVFWNGVRVGGCGTLPPHLRMSDCWKPIELPPGKIATEAVVAIRVFVLSGYHLFPPGGQGLSAIPVIGSGAAVAASTAEHLYLQERSERVSDVLGLLYAIAGVITLVVWLLNRRERLYLWLAMFLLLKALRAGLHLWASYGSLDFAWDQMLIFIVGYGCMFAALWLMLMRLFRLDQDLLWRRLTARMIVVYQIVLVANQIPMFQLSQWTERTALSFRICWILQTVLALYSLVLIGAGVRRKLDPARWCVVATATAAVLFPVIYNVFQLLQRWDIGDHLDAPLFTIWGGGVSVRGMTDLLLLLALAYAAAQSLIEARRQRTETELELRSAAEVQHVLLPEEIPNIAGLTIKTVYKPAGQVGGDFFQIIPIGTDEAIVAIGDVSGKGMPAAMTVSLLVGTLRTLAHYTNSPGEMLAAMNQRMLGRSNGGFTTCLVLRITAGGEITLANAGHLAPYIGGKELPVETGLPLGLVEGIPYLESHIRLAPGDQLTLLTDGIVEARSASGELFGFNRTATIVSNTAESIAEAGSAFGQEDDITVLTLALTPAEAHVR